MAKVLKPFQFGARVVHPGDEVDPDETHLKQLVRGGLVEGAAEPEEGDDPVEVEGSPGVVRARPKPSRRAKIVGKQA